MQLQRFSDPQAFYRQALPFLLAREAEHNLLLGLAATLIDNPGFYPLPPYLALVHAGEQVLAAALRTPPYNLVLSETPQPAVAELFARDLAAAGTELPGVLGPTALSRSFAETWQALIGKPYRLKTAERIYRLEQVQPVAGVPGAPRQATEADRNLLIEWYLAFSREALGEDDRTRAERNIANRLPGDTTRGIYLWDDGGPVSLAGYGGATPNGIRIGPVYTPPALRRRGYAAACVAHLSQMLLNSGRRFCFLFTDLSNPTSNHIYQQIGYQSVCDVDEYVFGP